jgi:hypothetical protein
MKKLRARCKIGRAADFSDFRPIRMVSRVGNSSIWTRLAKMGQIGPELDAVGQIWTGMAKSGQVVDKNTSLPMICKHQKECKALFFRPVFIG